MEPYSISFEEFAKIVFDHKKVEISAETEKTVRESYEFLKNFSKDKEKANV